MALYVSGSAIFSGSDEAVIATFKSAPTYSGTETNYFSEPIIGQDGANQFGSLIARLPDSYIGTQLSALPDVVNYGGFLITDEVFIASIAIYGHYTITNNGTVVEEGIVELAAAQSQTDEVLATLFPDDSIVSNFAKIIVPNLPSDSNPYGSAVKHFDGLYVVVEGSKGTGSLQQLDVVSATEGRFLLAAGPVGGQRDEAWGDWINPVGPTTPPDPYADLPDTYVTDAVTYSTSVTALEDGTGTALTNEITGLEFADDGSAMLTDGSGQTSEWSEISTAVKESIAAGLSQADAVAQAGAKIVGKLAGEVVESLVEENITDPLVDAVLGEDSTARDVAEKGQIIQNFHERLFDLLSKGMDSVTGEKPLDPEEYDKELNSTVKSFFSDVLSNITGISEEDAALVVDLGEQISTHGEHSVIGLSASFASRASTNVVVLADGHSDTFVGDRFANSLRLGDGNDGAWGGDGNDRLVGEEGDDLLLGGLGRDTLLGGTGNDRLAGGGGADKLDGGSGADDLRGGAGADNLLGGSGGDRLDGGAAIDKLDGGAGNDILSGGLGRDTLIGGLGADRLSGGGDADRITGGAGRDVLTGGAGADRFIFTALADFAGKSATRADQITDFSRAQQDLVDLSAIDANSLTAGTNEAFTWIGSAAFSRHAGELRFTKSGTSTMVLGDSNGDGAADFALVLAKAVPLAAADFVL